MSKKTTWQDVLDWVQYQRNVQWDRVNYPSVHNIKSCAKDAESSLLDMLIDMASMLHELPERMR